MFVALLVDFLRNVALFQVISWVHNGESMLTASFICPDNMVQAEQLKNEHERFVMAIEVSCPFINHVYCHVLRCQC